MEKMPLCLNTTERKCFNEAFASTLEQVNQQACTTLQFHALSSELVSTGRPNTSVLQITFDPPKVTVQEEYLIFDTVAMISSIGGTLGLCIGFSFTEFTAFILRFIERLL